MIRNSLLFRSLVGSSDKVRFCHNEANNFKKFNPDDEDEEMRDKILNASLIHVPTLGWTPDAVRAGVSDLGYPSTITGVIKRPGIELIHHHIEQSNAKIEKLMRSSLSTESKKDPQEFLKKSIETRLRMNIPYASKWPEALAIMTVESPCKSFEHGLNLMDIIWNVMGDQSVDFNWYSKRLSLGLLYKSAELAMINDQSPDYAETWEFLERRLNDYHALGRAAENICNVPNVFQGVASTVTNMIGLRK